MGNQATDVDRALAAIGGVTLNYRAYGPRPIPKHNPELDEIFVYNEAGVGEYRAPIVVAPEPEIEPEFEPSLAGLPPTEAMSSAAPLNMQQALPEPAGAPEPVAPPIAAPVMSRDRPQAPAHGSAIGAEARSLAAMFNMLAGKTHGQAPAAPPAAVPEPRADTGDLFRRL